MWISGTKFGAKKIVSFYLIALLGSYWLKIYSSQGFYLLLGTLIPISLFLLIELYTRGINIRKHVFTLDGERYVIRDKIYFNNPKHNLRQIVSVNDERIILSQIFTQKDARLIYWAFFDVFRQLIIKLPHRINRVLILGGGAGALALTIRETCTPTSVDVVEISRTMTNIAQKYFNLEEKDGIKLYNQDGFKFVKQITNPYDLIIVDISYGAKLPTQMKDDRFINHLKLNGKTVIVNLGFEELKLKNIIEAYKRVLPKFTVLLFNKNFIGINRNINPMQIRLPQVA